MGEAGEAIRATSRTATQVIHQYAAPKIARPLGAPSGFEPGVRYEAGLPVAVTLPVGTIPEDEAAWRATIKAKTGLEVPADRRVEIQGVRYWGDPASPNIYVRFGITDRSADSAGIDVGALASLIRRRKPSKSPQKRGTSAARVVVLSDLQVGKVDRDGGTDALLDRVLTKVDKVAALMRADQVPELVIVDPGDLIENFSNTVQQAHTNDLSLPDQLHVARHILLTAVDRLSALVEHTRVITVPSNHGQWRSGRGKGSGAGRPGDDFGIDVHRAVAQAFTFKGRDDVVWRIPEPWEESLALEVVPGFVLGLVHGHQWRANRAPDWWRGQSLGDAPTAAAHMLIHGHWHHSELAPFGALDGRPRWILGADALDGGSSWFTNLTGDAAEASITTFTVAADGRWDNYRRIV